MRFPIAIVQHSRFSGSQQNLTILAIRGFRIAKGKQRQSLRLAAGCAPSHRCLPCRFEMFPDFAADLLRRIPRQAPRRLR